MRALVTSLVAVLAAASPALAEDVMPKLDTAASDGARRGSTWTLELGSYARWLGDGSAAALTPGTLLGGRITIGRHLLTLPGPRRGFELGAFVRVLGGTSEGQIFQTLDTRLSQLGILAGARLDLDLWRGISATAQIDLGPARTSATIGGDTLGAMAPVDDSAWGFLGGVSLGVKYDAVWRRRYSFGLAAELGYAVTSPVALRAYPRTRPEDELSIPTIYAALGHLDTRGTTFAVTMRLGF
jgi:hypothetical protein